MPRFDAFRIRDPFILPDGGKYYMYESGTTDDPCDRQVYVRVSHDLTEFSDRIPVFTPPADFWADRDFWAPEVHLYKGAYYLFLSLKSETACRATEIFRAESPLGPFTRWSRDEKGNFAPITPRDWECLDGTLFMEDGVPYMVFCHEWLQVKDGEMCAVRLTEDLSAPAGEPFLLFKASESGWAADIRNGEGCRITDGPYLRRMASGALMLIWSSAKRDGDGTCYATGAAISESGRLTGPWHHRHPFLFHKDGGHAMFFTDHTGTERLVLHQPNKPAGMERARLFTVTEENGEVRIRE